MAQGGGLGVDKARAAAYYGARVGRLVTCRDCRARRAFGAQLGRGAARTALRPRILQGGRVCGRGRVHWGGVRW